MTGGKLSPWCSRASTDRQLPGQGDHAAADEQRRALQLLARSPNGSAEALMMAGGFEVALLGKLVLDGHALATPH
jgi:hypothetical protein